MRFMLSFDHGKKVAVALGKDNKPVFYIRITEEKELPDIQCDDSLELISNEDIKQLKSAMKLGSIEIAVIKKLLKERGKKTRGRDGIERAILPFLDGKIDMAKIKASDKIKRALQILEEKCNMKLKEEIDFTRDPSVHSVIPIIGDNKDNFDRSIFLCAASGAGKSWLAKLIIENDLKKRPVVLFSKIPDDTSLESLEREKIDNGRGKKVDRLIKIPLLSEEDLLDLPALSDLADSKNGVICMFDDIDAFHSDIAQYIREYRDSLLECGRHSNITCICTSHLLNNYSKTKIMLNEAELVVLFPNSNRRHSDLFLSHRLGVPKHERDFMIEKAMRAGRFLAMRMSAPNMIIHNQGVVLV